MPPKWDGKIWVGDSATASIRRAQDNESISCTAPDMDEMLCISGADFQRLIETYVLGCKKWRSDLPSMSADDVRKINKDIGQ
jgi:hypothetical protein